MGRFVYSVILFTTENNSFGPSEQFTPKALTPKLVNVFATISGLEPVRVLSVLSKVIVAYIGRFVFSFKAKIQALISYKSENVSTI